MVSPIILPEITAKLREWNNPFAPWFKQQAVASIANGWFENIMDRKGKDLYLLRIWMHEPKPYGPDNAHSSANAAMLHYFVRPDDDGVLHDHPWDFTTRILCGGYTELRPTDVWSPVMGGPAYGEAVLRHGTDAIIRRKAADLHAISEIAGEVWTLVTTGPKIRTWGFHPEGQPWVPWRTYLGLDHPNYKAGATPIEKVQEQQREFGAFEPDIRDPVDGRLIEAAP